MMPLIVVAQYGNDYDQGFAAGKQSAFVLLAERDRRIAELERQVEYMERRRRG